MRLTSLKAPAICIAFIAAAGATAGAAAASPLAATALSAPIAVVGLQAQPVQYYHHRGPRYGHYGYRHGYTCSHRHDGVAAGLAAGAIGALALGGLAASGAFDPEPQRYAPMAPPRRQWCAQRYRSYNPADGTFIGRDGRVRFCG